jgi:hypothetical protein
LAGGFIRNVTDFFLFHLTSSSSSPPRLFLLFPSTSSSFPPLLLFLLLYSSSSHPPPLLLFLIASSPPPLPLPLQGFFFSSSSSFFLFMPQTLCGGFVVCLCGSYFGAQFFKK